MNTQLEWCQLNALQASPVVHLVTPLSCVSLSMNTQPSVPAIIYFTVVSQSETRASTEYGMIINVFTLRKFCFPEDVFSYFPHLHNTIKADITAVSLPPAHHAEAGGNINLPQDCYGGISLYTYHSDLPDTSCFDGKL